MRQHIKSVNGIGYPESKYIINLDKNFKPVVGVEIGTESFDFKGGEPHFRIIWQTLHPLNSELVITQRYNKVADLFKIILANDAAKRIGFKNISLVLPYFPAARQDRVCNEGEPLTIKVFADMINSCGFDEVTILCPHSEVTPALINNVKVLDELKYVEKIFPLFPSHAYNIVCPDAGAGKRVGKVVNYLSNKFPRTTFNLIRCEKDRDVKDGSLKGFFVQADDLGGLPTLIVDDINSMGGTFIGLGKELKQKKCGELLLFTSHADCYEGIKRITENFDHYFTTNSKENWGTYHYPLDGRVTCFNIEI